MSTKKQTKQSNSLIKENSVNVIEGIEKSMAATCIRQTSNAKARKDTTTDNTMHNAARLLGKISQGAINNNNTSTDQEATGNVKKMTIFCESKLIVWMMTMITVVMKTMMEKEKEILITVMTFQIAAS